MLLKYSKLQQTPKTEAKQTINLCKIKYKYGNE